MTSSTLITSSVETDVLLVDDNTTVLKTLQMAFRQLKPDLRVHQASSPQEAEQKLSQSTYKVIFIDLILQNNPQAGLELIEKIATQTRGVIILYTAYACDPIIRERIEKKSEEYRNFSVFVHQKEASYQKLEEILNYYVALDPDLPPSFINLVRELERDIQASKNRQVFEQGRVYAKGLEKLEELRKELKAEIERLQGRKEDSPRLSLLTRQYDKIKGEWYKVLADHLPNAPNQITVWWYYQYYVEFSAPQLHPHLDKVKITQYKNLYTIFTFSGPTNSDSSELKSRKEIVNAQEKAFFYELIQKASQDDLRIVFQVKNLRNYLALRKELWQQNADIPPEFVFRLATQYTLTGVKAQVPKLVTTWQEGGVRQLQKDVPPINILAESVEKMGQVSKKLAESPIISPQWQIKANYQWFEGDYEDALNQLESSKLVVALDKTLSSPLLLRIVKQLIPQLKDGQKHQIYSLDTIDPQIYTKANLENFILQSAELMQLLEDPEQKKMLFIVESSFVQKLDAWSQEWQEELVNQPPQDPFERHFYQILRIFNTPSHFLMIRAL